MFSIKTRASPILEHLAFCLLASRFIKLYSWFLQHSFVTGNPTLLQKFRVELVLSEKL